MDTILLVGVYLWVVIGIAAVMGSDYQIGPLVKQ